MKFTKKIQILLILLITIILCGCNDLKTSAYSINYLMFNDTHGAFVDEDGNVGIGKVASTLESLEKNYGNYITIANGDIFQGTYVSNMYYGLPMIEALNAINLDCFVLGNHEFDWGLEEIAKYKDGDLSNGEADFPFLGANIFYKGLDTKPEWIEDYTIVESNNTKVGIIGIIGERQESSILAENVKDYEFVEATGIIKKLAKELRKEKNCDSVVLAVHDYDIDLNSQVAEYSGDSAIDAIFCGHTHRKEETYIIRSDNKKIVAVENYDKNESIVTVELKYGPFNKYEEARVEFIKPYRNQISSTIKPIIEKYQSTIDAGNRVIGSCDFYLSKESLGTHATVAMKERFNADVAIMNTGGIRATISAGNIKISDVFNVFPFNNEVIVVKISGSNIKDLYNMHGDYLYFDDVSAISSLNSNTIYTVAVIDYVYQGSRYHQIFGNTTPNKTRILMRDVMIERLENFYGNN